MSIPPPHPTLTTLVPFLFSPDDSLVLPRSLVSQPTLQAHHYLALSPTDDRYWTLGNKDSDVVLARREILESGQVDSVELGTARYYCDPSDHPASLKALIPVSLPSSNPTLDVILLFEPHEPETPHDAAAGTDDPTDDAREAAEGAWKLFKLTAPSIVLDSPDNGFHALVRGGNSSTSAGRRSSVAQSQWCDTIEEAVARANDRASTSKLDGQPRAPSTAARQSRPSGLDLSESQDGRDGEGDEYDEYGTRRRTGTARVKTREEMAEGEGTTPGAYGDSNDFWAGWSDSEEEEHEADSGVGFVNDTRGRDTEKEDDDDYWRGYGAVTNQVDDGRSEGPAVIEESPVIGYEATTSATVVAPRAAAAESPTKVKTRSRRSSTVTPFNLSTLSSPTSPRSDLDSCAPRDPTTAQQSSSFLTFDSPAQSSAPFSPEPATSITTTTTVAPPPLLASAVKLAAVTGQESRAPNDALGQQEDDNLRFALAGVWGLFKGQVEGRQERRTKFERIVGEVLRS